MAKMSLDLSDDLAQLATNFEQFSHGGLVMDGETCIGIVAEIRKLHRAARRLENEVSRKRWNDAARTEQRHELARVLDEVTRPGSNVKLFPVIHRPFSDGQPHGAA